MTSTYTSLDASIDGLMSSVHLTWERTFNGTKTGGVDPVNAWTAQTLYYTDVYKAADGSELNESKSVELGVGDLSATIIGLTSARAYTFTLRGTDNAATPVTSITTVSSTPNQPPDAPVFTVVGGNAKAYITVTNHVTANTHYEIFVNGYGMDNGDANKMRIRTIPIASGTADNVNKTWIYELPGLTNSTDENEYYYEIGMQATTSVKTSAMSSGSQAVLASDRLAEVDSFVIITGKNMPSYTHQGILQFSNNGETDEQYYWKAFPKDTTKADMIANSRSQGSTWAQATLHTGNTYNANVNGLELDTEYEFAVVPATIAKGRSHVSLASATGVLTGLPGTEGIVMQLYGGIDISNGVDTMEDADMSGNLRLRYSMTQAAFEALDNGAALTAITFDMSGSDSKNITAQTASAVDVSSGVVNFTGLRHDVDYKVRVFTTNDNGAGAKSAYTSPVVGASTLPTNLAITAGPLDNASSPYLANASKIFDITADASGNGATPLTFSFDISGEDDAMRKSGLTEAQINALPLALGKSYQIGAKATNPNGKDTLAIGSGATIRPSAPPKVKGTSFAETQIDVVSTSITTVVVNINNMQREDYGYSADTAKLQLVYDDSINANGQTWESAVQDVTDKSANVSFTIPNLADAEGHTHFKLLVTPYNGTYGSGYQVDATAPDGYTSSVTGLNTFTSPLITVTTVRAVISNLASDSVANDMDKSLKFKWQATKAGEQVEILVARVAVNSDKDGHPSAAPKYADYKLIEEMTTTKYVKSGDEMLYELSNNALGVVPLANGSSITMVNGDKYYLMVRDKDYPMNYVSVGLVPYGLPIISDLKLSDYVAVGDNSDLVTFKVNPNGTVMSNLFMIDNLSTDKIFDLMPSASPHFSSDKIVGDVYVRLSSTEISALVYTASANNNNLYINVVAGNASGVTVGTAINSVTDYTGELTPLAIYNAANTALSSLKTIKDDAATRVGTINGQNGNLNNVDETDTASANYGKSLSDLKNAEIIALHALAVKAVADAETAKNRGLRYDVTAGTSDGKTAQQCLADAETAEVEHKHMVVQVPSA